MSTKEAQATDRNDEDEATPAVVAEDEETTPLDELEVEPRRTSSPRSKRRPRRSKNRVPPNSPPTRSSSS